MTRTPFHSSWQWMLPLVLCLLLGCHSHDDTAKQDEAKIKADELNLTNQEAARQWFLPKSYYDPPAEVASDYAPNQTTNNELATEPEGTESSSAAYAQAGNEVQEPLDLGIKNFFAGMDTVALLKSESDSKSLLALDRIPTPQLTDIHGGQEIEWVDRVTSSHEVLGRNTWMVWCGGNEGFWDWLARKGFIDLLKLTDSRNRGMRFKDAGIINEPNMRRSHQPEFEYEFGLWLDRHESAEAQEEREAYLRRAFERINQGDFATFVSNEDEGESYRYQHIEPPEIYGLSSGIVGLRLFPNPAFDRAARAKWDATRFYEDKDYYLDADLVRPFRVGMSCAFCHTSYHPLNPPSNLVNPEWENLSGNIGAQYLRIRAAFGNLLTPDNFIYHILDSQPPGTIDTSLIASDNINNPNTMNAVFNLPQRALLPFSNPPESISRASLTQPNLWRMVNTELIKSRASGRSYGEDYDPSYDAVPREFIKLFEDAGQIELLENSNAAHRFVPRILLDGSDSIGGWGAFARVYLNIGTYYEQWNELHRPVVGFEKQRPFTIKDCDENSVYWQATQDRVAALRDYFLKISNGMPLAATKADDSIKYVDASKLKRGREVFAKNCVVCHSSIQPESIFYALKSPSITSDSDGSSSDNSSSITQDFSDLIRRRRQYRGLDQTVAVEQNRSRASSPEYLIERDPERWVRDEAYQNWAQRAVEDPKFWQLNFLSSDMRVPVNLVETNSARSMATNAIAGNMWDDFASDDYQLLPSVGEIAYFNPYASDKDEEQSYTPQHKNTEPAITRADNSNEVYAEEGGGGPGYYRVPSLVSLWATAPYFHNNSLGEFNNDPSVAGRMSAFNDGIEKLLWPEKRLESSSYNGATAERLRQDHGLIWRTDQETYLTVNADSVPDGLARELSWIMHLKDSNEWINAIRPLWLPSLILLVASFTLLVFQSKPILHTLAILSGVFGLVWLPFALTEASIGDASRWQFAMGMIWITVTLVLISMIYFVVAKPRFWRRLSGFTLLAGLLLASALAVLFFAQPTLFMEWAILVVVAIALILFAAFVFWVAQRDNAPRFIAYGLICLALFIGGGLYFFNGHLGDVRIGPFPKGTPVNLIANINPDADPKKLKDAIAITLDVLYEIKTHEANPNWTDEDSVNLLREKAAPVLMEVSKCPDMVMDRGHDFPWFDQMTDDDKRALIELLKTF